MTEKAKKLGTYPASEDIKNALKKERERVSAMLKFCKRMAKHENGCSPAVWYFDELIEQAREALKHYDNE
jgi:hypothetical protein